MGDFAQGAGAAAGSDWGLIYWAAIRLASVVAALAARAWARV